jgi:hypothetical protein
VPIVDGVQTPGTTGRAKHLGDPLTCEQIRELPDGAEVVITWDGGNGPHPYRVLVDTQGYRRAEGLYNDRLLPLDGILESGTVDGGLQKAPLHRITLGWDDAARAWFEGKPGQPDHILERQEILRGIPQPAWTDGQMRLAAALEEISDRLSKLPWTESGHQCPLVVQREHLFVACNEAAKVVFGTGKVKPPYPGGPTVRWAAMLTEPGIPDAGADDKAIAAAILDVEQRLFELAYRMPGGVPVVDRDLIFAPVDAAAAAALGEHYYRRALRRARNSR